MFKARYAIFLMAALSLLLGILAAQDAGQFLILNAQYGTERSHVDVTARLRDLASRDRPFRISHDSMALDPARGQAKMLRVFARGGNGRERIFDFPDGSVFDGAQFRGWGRGDWGDEHWTGGWYGRNDSDNDAGEYLILTAQYGNESRHVDVTDRLKQLARQDRVFRLDYRTFGVDPAEGRSKELRIFARGPNGQERMFEYADNTLIDGSIFRDWGNGEWGGGGWSGRWNGGGDRDDGDAGMFLILSAQYGSERRHVDVTSQLKELARTDAHFRVDFRTFRVDPDEGHAKVLRIYARGPHGRERMFEYRDGEVIDGGQFRGWSRGEWAGENDRWSGRWEGEEREEREHDRDRDRQ
jgi:hypothetical protein